MDQFAGADNRPAMINLTNQGNTPGFQAKPLFEDYETQKRRRRYEELSIKFKAAPESFDDVDELAGLMKEFE
jgi:hypothetical protein